MQTTRTTLDTGPLSRHSLDVLARKECRHFYHYVLLLSTAQQRETSRSRSRRHGRNRGSCEALRDGVAEGRGIMGGLWGAKVWARKGEKDVKGCRFDPVLTDLQSQQFGPAVGVRPDRTLLPARRQHAEALLAAEAVLRVRVLLLDWRTFWGGAEASRRGRDSGHAQREGCKLLLSA